MQNVQALIDKVIDAIVNPLIAIFFAAAVVVFFWGLIQFLYHQGADSEKREDGKRGMIWGLIGMFIMLSAYGLLRIFTNTFGIPLN